MECDLRKMDKRVTIIVRITREARLRVWLASRLIRLAALVLGCGVRVEEEER